MNNKKLKANFNKNKKFKILNLKTIYNQRNNL